MAILKCKICGGDIDLSDDKTLGMCAYCGSTTTFPKLDSDERAAMFNRGNHFRRSGEFDKALAIYERIVEENDADAEAHWCCALCRFGIDYVEDPTTLEYIPTCHRASFDSFLEDVDYQAALENSDGITRRQYQKDAAKIAEVQKGILATSQTEEPFDVFICYKESDETGGRTKDSALAQDIYYQLTEQGYRVFFSRITLEDKAGAQYEPYIFAALNSAKVMVAIGTSAENFNSVWVKNEWSRFLALMKKDRSKLLLPCYKDMDPYDLPEALSVLQSYDMSKIGFIQDLVRGIKKVIDSDKQQETVVKETVVVNNAAAANVAPLLKRTFMFLEDGEWESADEYCERVLDINPENAEAYLGKLMAEMQCRKRENLKDCAQLFDSSNNYQKAYKFGDENLRKLMADSNSEIRYRNFVASMGAARTEEELKAVARSFETIIDYKDAKSLKEECLKKAESIRKDAIYVSALQKQKADKIYSLESAIKLYATISGWKDADSQVSSCQKRIAEKERKIEEARLAVEAQKKKVIMITKITTPIVAVCVVFLIVLNAVIIPSNNYKKAIELYNSGEELAAMGCFIKAKGYKNSSEYLMNWNVGTVSAGSTHTAGLKSDGTVVATKYTGDYYEGQCDVSSWKDVVAISAGDDHTVGLKSDGTVVAVGYNGYGQCDVSDWKGLVAISAGSWHTVGLKSDGTAVAVGWNDYGQCDVSDWKDIVAISAGSWHTVGLKSDGTAVAVGYNRHGQCDITDWEDIKTNK